MVIAWLRRGMLSSCFLDRGYRDAMKVLEHSNLDREQQLIFPLKSGRPQLVEGDLFFLLLIHQRGSAIWPPSYLDCHVSLPIYSTHMWYWKDMPSLFYSLVGTH